VIRPWLVLTALSVLCACPAGTAQPSPDDAGTPPGATSGLPAELRPPTSTSRLEPAPEGPGLPEHLKPPR
jgi:hypothetical protein